MSTQTKSGRMDGRELTTYSHEKLGDSIQAKLGSWDPEIRKGIPVMVDGMLNRIQQALMDKHSVRFKKIGTICVKFRQARKGARVISTGKPVDVTPRWTATMVSSSQSTKGGQPTFIWSDMILFLCETYSLSEDKARELYTELHCILNLVASGACRIEIRGLGTFTPSFQKGGKRRNPKTGETVTTKDSYRIHFKVSDVIKQKVYLVSDEAKPKAA